MNRISWLTRLAVLVWLAWLGLVGTMLGMLKLQVWHPHFLPITAPLVVLLFSGLALLVAGTWRLVRGPGRRHALVCLLLGLPPLGFLAGHLLYGFGTANGRRFELNLPLRLLVPFGESIMDLVTRFVYPVRTEGQRVVMISQPVENARDQVAAMDRHIEALEARLGRTGTRRVHWVRGPILGLQGRAILGMCLGSLPGEQEPDVEGLTTLDRHEVAHVVLSQFCTTAMEPPAILMEGWAEVAAAADMKAHRLRAWSERESGGTLPLEELVGPRWYSRHESQAYVQGAPLVDYILRQFGPERFVELYATCTPKTFAADCRRILGVSVAKLDRDCWADLEKSVGPGGYAQLWLASLPLGPKVDPAQWRRFIADYVAAAGRMLALYDHVRLVAQRVHQTEDAKGQKTTYTTRYELKRSGPLRAFRISSRDREEVYLAHPEHSFQAERKTPAEAWEIREDPTMKPEMAYRRIVREIDLTEPVRGETVPLFAQADFATTLVNPLSLRVTLLKRFTENCRRFIRLEFEGCPPGNPIGRKFSLRIAADDFSVVHEETVSKGGDTWRSDSVYESRDGAPLWQTTQSKGRWGDGTLGKIDVAVNDRKFEPVPDDEFTRERLLGDAPVHRVARRAQPFEVSPLLSWYPLPIILSVLSLAAGAGLLTWSRRYEAAPG
jgi:hypothetical protein